MKFLPFIILAEFLFCLSSASAKSQWVSQSDSLFQASRYQAALELLGATRPQSVDEEILWHLEQGRHRTYLADYDEAMCHLQDAEMLVLMLRNESHPLLPAIYDRLGEWYRWRYLDSQKAICLSNRALILRDQYHPRDSLGLAQTYYQLGRAYQELEMKRVTGHEDDNQKIALAFFQAAMEVPGLKKHDPDTYGWILNRQAVIHHTLVTRASELDTSDWNLKYEKVFDMLAKSDSVFKSHFHLPHFGMSQNAQNYGNFWSDKVAYSQSVLKKEGTTSIHLSNRYFEQCLHDRIQLFGKQHPKVALMYHLIGHNLWVIRDIPAALAAFDQATELLLPDTPLDSTLHLPVNMDHEATCPPYLVYNLQSIGLLYRHLLLCAESLEDKQRYALATFHSWKMSGPASRMALLRKIGLNLEGFLNFSSHGVTQNAIYFANVLRETGITPDPKVLFETIEAGHGLSFQYKEYGPQFFHINGEILDLQAQIDSFRLQSVTSPIYPYAVLLDSIFVLSALASQHQELIIRKLARHSSLRNLQEVLREDDAEVLFVNHGRAGFPPFGDSLALATFLITPDTISGNLRAVHYHTFDSLTYYLSRGDLSDRNAFLRFCFWSNQVYKSIFQVNRPLMNRRKLIMIAAGDFVNLPYDLLLTDSIPPSSPISYRGLPFLLQEVNIQFHYSLDSYIEGNHQGYSPVSRVISFLPDFSLDTNVITAPVRKIDLTRMKLAPLPGARREAQYAETLLGATTLTDGEAREDNFRRLAPDADIIHLATHGVANPVSPLESRIALKQQPTTSPLDPNDGFLFSREVYGMKLDCELAVLSACQTGTGRFSEGEGVLNFAHAFQFAGARSVLTTLWPVPDSTSADIIIEFFRGLEQGYPKSVALAHAKRKYLQHADELHSHPYFWAGYVLTGSDQPIQLVQRESMSQILLFLASISILLLLTLFLWSRFQSRK